MELKVWVDGIKRVVCGVTDNTTCQDIVIALAQAMGRTGRFTLMEIWRDNERPLSPSECPLLVLQKWGEFANEVKLVLYESGTRRKQRNFEKEKESKKPQDRFTHNFTPPVKTSEAVIRRSLTFSGSSKNTNSGGAYAKSGQNELKGHSKGQGAYGQNRKQPLARVSEKVTSDGNSWSSNSSLSSQNSTVVSAHHRRQRSTSRDRISSHPDSGPSSLPTYTLQHSSNTHGKQGHPSNQWPPNHSKQTVSGYPMNSSSSSAKNPHGTSNRQQSPFSVHHTPNVPSENGPVRPASRPGHSTSVPQNHSSAFSIVRPRSAGPACDSSNSHNPDIPLYTDFRFSSQQTHKTQNMEEYDLDSNFPDVVKETGRDFLIEEYHVPGQQGSGQSHHRNQYAWEEEERVKLLRLVTMQNERIKMQDSQLEIIDTEIESREQKIEDLKLEISQVTEEISKLTAESEKKLEEMQKLENGNLIDAMEAEKLAEREIKNEINALRSRLQKCENDLYQFQAKVKNCCESLEKEAELQKTDEKRRKEEEIKLQKEISDIKKEIDGRTKDAEEKNKVFVVVEEELKEISNELSKKAEELTATEKELQQENLKFFRSPQATDTVKGQKPGDSNGEAVLKVLEGNVTPHVKRNKLVTSPLTVLQLTKTKNGVWV